MLISRRFLIGDRSSGRSINEALHDQAAHRLGIPPGAGGHRDPLREVAESDFPQEIRWIRSYVIEEEGGELGTVCIYEASDEDAVRRHAERVGMPADEVRPVADTVIVRPDPAAAAV